MMEMKNMWKYVALIAVVGVAGYYSDKIKQYFDIKEADEYELIKKYLLNDSPLYGYNKPKIWIHTKYDLNARKWRDFQSRNTNELNQPYIHITIKSIINHCANDFHICLIDDNTFRKLIPSWDMDLTMVAEPLKSQYRQLGIAQLIYYYGGVCVPNSFLCTRNLKGLYEEGIRDNKPFVCEAVNRTTNLQQGVDASNRLFIPSTYFMGAKKNDLVLLEYIEYLKQRSSSGHFTSEYEFVGDSSIGCLGSARLGKMNVIDGKYIGIKTVKRRPVLIEDLLEENYLGLEPDIYGIYIPEQDVLTRPKYQWFAVLNTQELLKSNLFIARHMKTSIIDSTVGSSEIKSMITI